MDEAKQEKIEVIIKEVHRWAGIIQNTASNILNTQPKKLEDKKVD
jgi:hypothetical protein